MGVVQNAILTQYFGGREIAFALALNVSFARFGMSVAISMCICNHRNYFE